MANPSTTYDFNLKIVIIGDSGTGKSCMTSQLVRKEFSTSNEMTIFYDIQSQTRDIETKKIGLQIWDMSGQDEVSHITCRHYNDTAIFFLVYDVTCRDSFKNIEKWHDYALSHNNPNAVYILVGNKTDLKDKSTVPTEEAEQFARDYNIQFYEISATSNHDIEDLFTNAAQRVLNKIDNGVAMQGIHARETTPSQCATPTLRSEKIPVGQLLTTYRECGGNNVGTIAYLATHNHDEGIRYLQQRAAKHIIAGNQEASASCQTLIKDCINLATIKSDLAHQLHQLKEQAVSHRQTADTREVLQTYRDNQGENLTVPSTLFFAETEPEKYDCLVKRARAAIHRGKFRSASIETLLQKAPQRLAEILAEEPLAKLIELAEPKEAAAAAAGARRAPGQQRKLMP